ncbi:MAG: FtsX-like permease family protein [FCB group bacterium]|nr:FtsX-like permease family protein [FCB group bacterium]
MSLYESLKMALAAIWANRLRSILTLFGVIVGVTSVITIISALEGLMGSIEDSLSALGPATFIVTKFGIITSEEDYFKALKRKDLSIRDMDAVAEGCPDCLEVSGRTYSRSSIKRGNQGLRRVPIGGSPANFIDVIDFEVAEGRYFTQAEYEHKNQVAFVGPTIVEELCDGVDPIGRTIKIKGRKFTIVGVAKKRGSMLGNNQDNFAFIPLTTHIKLFGKPRHNFNLAIKSNTIEGIEDTMDQARVILRARRGVDYKEEDDFDILTAENILGFVENTTRMVRVALVGISSIALVVGGIVIMNIMMVSVTERTREIGIRKSIGARRKNVLTQFLFEALILSMGGGMIGTALGIVIAIILGGQISLPVEPSLFAISAGLSISTGVGVFFGLYPAVKASNMNPIEALRFET